MFGIVKVRRELQEMPMDCNGVHATGYEVQLEGENFYRNEYEDDLFMDADDCIYESAYDDEYIEEE